MKTMLAVAALTFATTMPLLHPAPAPVSGPYSLSVTIRPVTDANPYQLLALHLPPPHSCTVEITDLSTHKVLQGPKVNLTPGERESKTSYVAGYSIDLSAHLSTDGSRARWTVAMRRSADSALVVSQTSDTQLRVAVER